MSALSSVGRRVVHSGHRRPCLAGRSLTRARSESLRRLTSWDDSRRVSQLVPRGQDDLELGGHRRAGVDGDALCRRLVGRLGRRRHVRRVAEGRRRRRQDVEEPRRPCLGGSPAVLPSNAACVVLRIAWCPPKPRARQSAVHTGRGAGGGRRYSAPGRGCQAELLEELPTIHRSVRRGQPVSAVRHRARLSSGRSRESRGKE